MMYLYPVWLACAREHPGETLTPSCAQIRHFGLYMCCLSLCNKCQPVSTPFQVNPLQDIHPCSSVEEQRWSREVFKASPALCVLHIMGPGRIWFGFGKGAGRGRGGGELYVFDPLKSVEPAMSTAGAAATAYKEQRRGRGLEPRRFPADGPCACLIGRVRRFRGS